MNDFQVTGQQLRLVYIESQCSFPETKQCKNPGNKEAVTEVHIF